MSTIKTWLYGVAGLLLAALLAFGAWKLYAAGEAHVQAQWDAAKLIQVQASVQQITQARHTEQAQAQSFAGIEKTYLQDSKYANALAPTTSAAVAAGTLRVRGCAGQARAGDGAVSAAAAGAGKSSGGPSGTAAYGSEAAIPAVRAVQFGDDADAREQKLREQVIALKSILKAEREGK